MLLSFIRALRSKQTTPKSMEGELPHPVAALAKAPPEKISSIQDLLRRAEAAFEQVNFIGAVRTYRSALEMDPHHVEALTGLSRALRALRLHDEAEACLRHALHEDSCNFEVIKTLLSLLVERRKLETATTMLESLDRGIQENPEILLLQARIKVAQYGIAVAADLYGKVLVEAPDHPVASEFLANVHVRLGNIDSALKVYENLVRNHPERSLSRYYYGLQLLRTGRFKEGIASYEARLDLSRIPETPPELLCIFNTMMYAVRKIPKWDRTQSLAGRRLLIWREQGLGDCLMMLRFVKEIRGKNPSRIALLLDQSLISLARSMNYADEVIDVQCWDPDGAHQQDFDFQCSIMSLPWLLNVGLEDLANNIPYLNVAKGPAPDWMKILNTSQLKVGLVWAGNPSMDEDRQRSVSLMDFAPLLAVTGIQFFSLQQGAARAQIQEIAVSVTDLMSHCSSFADTALIIQQLDLVIAVDTAVVHLAGGMGKPVWMLNRAGSEWRWMVDRNDSPWYPFLRIFNQSRGEPWSSVITRMADELSQLQHIKLE